MRTILDILESALPAMAMGGFSRIADREVEDKESVKKMHGIKSGTDLLGAAKGLESLLMNKK